MMANGVDGDITLSVSLSPTDIRNTSKQLQSDIENIFKSSAGKDLDNSFKSLQAQMSSTVTRARELTNAMDKLATQQVPTQEYKEIESQIAKASAQFNSLNERMEKFIELGGSHNSKQFKRMQYDASQLEGTIEYAKGELQDLVDTGKAFTLGKDTDAYQGLANKLGDVNNKMVLLKARALDASSAVSESTSSMNDYSTISKQATNVSSRLTSALSKLANAFKHTKKSHADFKGGLDKGFKMLLKYAFGIRSVFILVRRIRASITEGLKSMAQLNNGANQTNKDISTLQSSLNQLKNSLATAFAPILTVITPALNALMDTAVKVLNVIGMLIARLTGASTFVRAKKIQQDYAQSLNNTAKAAKEARTQLLGIDELNVLNKDNDSGGAGAGTDVGQMFEEVPIPDNIKKLADMLAKYFEPFKRSWDKAGKYVMDSWKGALNSTLKLLKDIGKSFGEVWMNGTGEQTVTTILYIVGDIGKTLEAITTQLDIAWTKADVGTRIIQQAWNILNDILAIIRECTSYTAEWASHLDFYPAFESLYNVLVALQPLVQQVMGYLADFYTSILLPLSQWALESALPAVLDTLAAILTTLSGALDAVYPVFKAFYEEVLVPIGEFAGESFITFLETAQALLTDFNEKVLPVLDDLIQDTIDLLVDVTDKNDTNNTSAKDFWKTIKEKLIPIGKQLNEILKELLKLIGLLMPYIKPVIDWIQRTVLRVINDIILAIQGVLAVVKFVIDEIAILINGIVLVVQDVCNMLDAISKGDWSRAWKSFVNIFIDIANTLMRAVERMINFIIDALNSIPSVKVPDWVPAVGGKNVGFNIPKANLPSIPRLAQGAVIPPNKEFMAMLGDQTSGTNVEAPLETIQDAVALVLQPYLEQLIANTEKIYNKDTSVNIGDRQIAQASIRGQRELGAIIRTS